MSALRGRAMAPPPRLLFLRLSSLLLLVLLHIHLHLPGATSQDVYGDFDSPRDEDSDWPSMSARGLPRRPSDMAPRFSAIDPEDVEEDAEPEPDSGGMSWQSPHIPDPRWLGKHHACMSHTSSKPSYCLYDTRVSARLASMLQRTWAPQANVHLKEVSLKHRKSSSHIGDQLSAWQIGRQITRVEQSCTQPSASQQEPVRQLKSREPHLIVFTALSGGRLCALGSHDWRANLPAYLGRMLNAKVIIYGQTSNTCHYCYNPEGRNEGCSADLHRKGADIVVMVGSGQYFPAKNACNSHEPHGCQQQYFDMWQLMSHRWAQAAKLVVHIRSPSPPKPPAGLFHIDVSIDTTSFVKPVSRCAREILFTSRRTYPENFVYVGKLTPSKGQLRFLKTVDPRMLIGTAVHFYGDDSNKAEKEAIFQVAAERKIDINVHGMVSKLELFWAMTGSKGMIMFGEDKNPASVFEGAAAWLPIFLARETEMAGDIMDQGFVQLTNRNHDGNGTAWKTQFHQDFFDFLAMADQDWMWLVKRWNRKNLREEDLYLEMCQRMCLCKNQMPHCRSQTYQPRQRVSSAPLRKPREDENTESMLAAALLDMSRPLPKTPTAISSHRQGGVL
mmetsp:Transcript_22461/g.62304  ORF Transcript_22461/g.62304 Transcript_22461/m.62304 type:complete len:614 (+) Transcript_22461:94-1935(+)